MDDSLLWYSWHYDEWLYIDEVYGTEIILKVWNN